MDKDVTRSHAPYGALFLRPERSDASVGICRGDGALLGCDIREPSDFANTGVPTMNVTLWLLISGIIGGTVGWIASVATRKGVTHYVTINIVSGAIGAMLGAAMLSPEFGSSLVNRGGIPLSDVIASSCGACLLVGIVFLYWRDRRT